MNQHLLDRLAPLRDLLLKGLVERDEPMRLALLAALAGEHILLLGPPGTAKSEIARRMRLAFHDQGWFERLLTRFTVPEELFGPLSLKALEEDRYHRQTEGYLPTATVAFLDEIWKANSAILNALLTLLNEREFDNGTVREKTPIKCVIAASNELPQDEGMEALYDRFLIRCHVGPVSESGFRSLLDLKGASPHVPEDLRLTSEDLKSVREAAANVDLPDAIAATLGDLRLFLAEKQIPVSDRRWRKIVSLLRVAACTNGRDTVTYDDVGLLPYCCWHKPEDREVLGTWCADRFGTTLPDLTGATQVTEAWEANLAVALQDRRQTCQALIDAIAANVGSLAVQDARRAELQRLMKPDPTTPQAQLVIRHEELLRTQVEAIRARITSMGTPGGNIWAVGGDADAHVTLAESLRQHEELLSRWEPIRRGLVGA